MAYHGFGVDKCLFGPPLKFQQAPGSYDVMNVFGDSLLMEQNVKPALNKANRDLARQWHPTKNEPLTPKDVTSGSSKRVWWKCKEGHEWRERVVDRRQRGGCPVCMLKARAPRLFDTM